MAQVINTNVASLNSQRQLNKSQSALSTTLERLSSGLRINSAKDDAAGLAISDRMTSQINGLNQAVRNANDGISLAQTAEGGLSGIGDSLQRLRQLAVQSANSSNSASDRAAINNEAQTLLAEITRVSSTTQFNGLNLLDGTFSNSQFQVGANANQTISVSISGASTSQIGTYQVEGSAVNNAAFTGTNLTITADGANNPIAIGVSVQTGAAGNNLVTADSAAAKATAINAKTVDTGVTATATNSVAGAAPIARADLASGALTINGVSIGAISGATTSAVQGANAAAAINAQTKLTGVTAVANASTGALTLTAADGRNIALVTADAAAAQAVQNATGLDASSGTNASGNESVTLTFDAAAQGAATGITFGDTVVLDGITYEFNTAAATVASDRVKVAITAGGTAANSITALESAIDAQYALGNTTLQTGTKTATSLVVTSDLLGTATVGASETSANAAAIVAGAAAGGTVAINDGTGTTTRGTLTLNSATGFTVTGTDDTAAGLHGKSTSKVTLSTIDLSTVEGSNDALSVIDGALAQVDTMRAELGAAQNRFTSVVSNLSTSAENLSASRSRIQDADFAAETAAMSKNQILQQAGTAMLAQANSMPQNVLSLLK